MLEILSPAGSPEGVVASVQNGADAVYLGFSGFNARKNAKNFTEDEFRDAAEYCRVRGVKTYVTLNTLASDRELADAVAYAKTAAKLGADAIIVQDLGVVRALRQALPETALHASTQMGIHNLEGVKLAAAMGLTRVVLARELPRDELKYICERSPIEIEVFVHGSLCMSYSGQCYMSAVIGRRSGNRGLCAQPCRLNYTVGGGRSEYLLSPKDNCLINHLEDLESIGVKCVKIEGRMKRPEYSAIVTGIYSRAAREKKPPTQSDINALTSAFSREGFTDGYYTGKIGSEMFGARGEEERGDSVIFSTARRNYLNGEFQRVPVWFLGVVKQGEPIRLVASDDRKNRAAAEGPIPELAFHKEMDHTALQTQLYKTGGTPYYCAGVKSRIATGLSLPIAAVNEMRRTLLTELSEKRKAFTPPPEVEFNPGYQLINEPREPVFTVSVFKAAQLSKSLAELGPAIVYVPISELAHTARLEPFLDDPDITVAASLPRVMFDGEREKVEAQLDTAKKLGIRDALVGNLGQIQLVRGLGFNARGDFGLNVYNSQTLRVARDIGLVSATLSFELMFAQIRDMSKPIDTEIIVYGRLPLMLTENCVIKNAMGVCACDNFSGLTDRQGVVFPVARTAGCRNVVLNSKKLFLADRLDDCASVGLYGRRLMFTTENESECVSVMKRYLGLTSSEPPDFTRGLYYKGVE
jgi:putative protease